jgi:hypothetical protein
LVRLVWQISTWLFAAMLLVVAPEALAAPTRVVLLTDARESDVAVVGLDAQLVAAASAQLAEIGVDVELRSEAQSSLSANARRAREIAASSPTLAVTWCKRDAEGLLIYFYDPSGPRLYSRAVGWAGSASAASEEIAIVIRSAVSAVQEGSAVGMSEVRLPEPLSAPVKVAPARHAEAEKRPATAVQGLVRLGASYVGTLYSTDAAWQHGAALSVSLRPANSRWFAGAAYTYFGALTITERGVHTQVRRHPGEVFVGWELRLAPFSFVAEGALVADRLERSTEQVPEGLSAAPVSRRWLWAISTRLGGVLPLNDSVRCFFNVGAEFLLNRFDYDVESASAREIVGSPMVARPRLELGVSVALW